MGCTACAQVCPARAIDYEDKLKVSKPKRVLTVNWDICIFCGQCEANCLTGKGIILSREFDFATTGKREELKQAIEKEFVLCECCQEPIVPVAQYSWVTKRLGPLIFTNSSLMFFYLRSLGLAIKQRVLAKTSLRKKRPHFYPLLPRCRREAVIKS